MEQVWCSKALEFLFEYFAKQDEVIIQEMKIDDIIEHIRLKDNKTCGKVQNFIAKHFHNEI